MKTQTIRSLAFCIAVGCIGVSSPVWAGGAGGGNLSCFVDTANSLGPSTFGTATLHGIPLGAAFNLDAVLRLQWSGKEQVFRAHVPTIAVISPEGTACDVLAANPRNGDGQTIQQAFGLGNATLHVTRRSITGVDWINPVPGSGNNLTLFDVTIYVVSH